MLEIDWIKASKWFFPDIDRTEKKTGLRDIVDSWVDDFMDGAKE